MAHRALTLKYRPQVFTDVIGQDHVSLVLARAVESGRIAHAYLFTGARGVGKTTSARILAKALNCKARLDGTLKGADPCNQCTSCLEITSGAALDVTEIDGASNRGIADVQALRERVRFSPTGGGYRVVIIDEVHQLSNDAFAALLKTLEEPPAHLVFVFATTDPQKLPDTIRSRTQRFDFARVPLRKVADRVLAIAEREARDPDGLRFTLAEDAALLIAHKSEGSMRDAVSALDQVVSAGEAKITAELVRRVLGLADREIFFALGGAIVAHDPKAALTALHQAFDKGLDARELAEGLAEHVRHLLILSVDPEGTDMVAASREEIARMKEQAGGWSEPDLLRLLRIASDVQWPLKESPQPLIHLEAAVVQMATLERGETLAELLARLDELERRLGGAASPASATRPPSSRNTSPSASSSTSAAPNITPRKFTPPGSPGTPPKAGAIAVPAHGAAIAPRAEHVAAPAASGTTPGAASTALADAPEPAAQVTAEIAAEHLACWNRAVEAVGKRKRMLGAFLEACRLVNLTGAKLVLAMDDLHRAVIEEKDNRAITLAEIATAFGRALELECVAPGATAAAEAAAGAADIKPRIEEAIRWFEGDIIERQGKSGERTGR
jgi:DNA polymerase III subunit gamma/tau